MEETYVLRYDKNSTSSNQAADEFRQILTQAGVKYTEEYITATDGMQGYDSTSVSGPYIVSSGGLRGHSGAASLQKILLSK